MSDIEKIKDLAMDAESIQDAIRVIVEMITDAVTLSELNTRESVLRAQERIIVLSNNAIAQLKNLETLSIQIRGACDA